nr:MAG TPA: hypothetical protein [Caudoviricetes sp.]
MQVVINEMETVENGEKRKGGILCHQTKKSYWQHS